MYVFFAIFLFWFYVSSRKYGVVDTVAFIVCSPFIFVFVLSNHYIKAVPTDRKSILKRFSIEAMHSVFEEINDKYTADIVDTKINDGSITYILETPFGLRMPPEEMIAQIAKKFHVPQTEIVYAYIAERKSSLTLRPAVFDAYMTAQEHNGTIQTLEDYILRLLCLRAPRVSQEQFRVAGRH